MLNYAENASSYDESDSDSDERDVEEMEINRENSEDLMYLTCLLLLVVEELQNLGVVRFINVSIYY